MSAAEAPEQPAVTVSVVVPTLDSAAQLARCLKAAQDQPGVDSELIVVDQGSRDDTLAIAAEHGASVVSLPRPRFYSPPTASRNAGARIARGRYLLHLDADMELSAGLLAACVEASERQGYVALVLHEEDVAEGYWATSKALERRCYHGASAVEAARFVRADAFWRAGGYDEALAAGEDWDIHRRYLRLGRVGDVSQPVWHHVGRLQFTRHLRKKFSYGRTARRFAQKHEGGPIVAAMIRAYWDSRQLLVRQPAHAVGLVLLRGAEASALLAGMLLGRLDNRPRRED